MIDTPNDEIRSHLLVGYRVDKKTKKINVGISSLLYPLFIGDLTDIDVIRKTKLKSQISRWLHDFYSSHSEPVPYTIQRIQELSRSNKQTSKFRKMIEGAIEELKYCQTSLDMIADFQAKTGREIALHWAFIAEQNDSLEELNQTMADVKSRGIKAKFNLVRYNPHSDRYGYEPEEQHIIQLFNVVQSYLPNPKSRIVPRVGHDVKASCGMFVSK